MEGDHPPRLNGNHLAGSRVAPRAWCLGANLKITKTGDLDVLATDQASSDMVKKSVHHVLGFTLVQADLLVQQFCELGLGEGRGFQAFDGNVHSGS